MDSPRKVPSLVLISAGAALVLVGSFLPWFTSGARARSSFELFAVVDRLEMSPDGVAGWGLRWWPAMPVLLLAGLALVWWQVPRLGAALTAASGLYAGGVVLAVVLAPVSMEIGALVTLAGVTLVLPAAALVAWPAQR